MNVLFVPEQMISIACILIEQQTWSMKRVDQNTLEFMIRAAVACFFYSVIKNLLK